MTNPRGESFWFEAGAACLEFGLSGGIGEWAVFETLHTPDDLRAWLAGPPLAVPLDRVTAGGLATARRVRHAILVAFFARAAGEPQAPETIEALNAAAARPPLTPQLGPDGETTTWAPGATLSQVLSTFARETIDILAGPLAERIKVCEGDNCTLPFVDTSRPGTRRWCSMGRCGNRHKLRAYRARHTP